MIEQLSRAEARRIALAAQGFGARRTKGRSDWPRIAAAIRGMGLLQIDSVNVLLRSHYLPLYARIGPYDRAQLDRRSLGRKNRQLFEYWAHEASFLPLESQPLLRWRMARARQGDGLYSGLRRFAEERPDYIARVRDEVADLGACQLRDLSEPGESRGPWWGWCDGKIALEYLFWTGEVTAAGRQGFERLYDLTERAIPPEILALPTPAEDEAIRSLVARSAQALGIATEAELRDYYRLPVAATKRALQELVEAGLLRPAKVAGWNQAAYLAQGAVAPTRVAPTALLSPFAPLVWHRGRTERLFGFHYRLELYTPAEKRRYGYYVLPFLMNGRLVGRVDLKSDREAATLRVLGAFAEPGVALPKSAEALAEELRLFADWLSLPRIAVVPNGDLAKALPAEI